MHHLSGLDATFLYMETPETPMHVGGLNIFELPPGYEGDFVDNLRDHITARMHLAPVFQRKLVNMPFELANPVWVADEDIDLEYHIRSTVLPRPGTRAQLDKLVGRLHSSLLDRSRPLWEFFVIEGLQTPEDAPAGTRHVAFYSKVHHAAVDGEAGVALANAIMDISAVPRTVKPASRARSFDRDNFGIAELVGAALKHNAVQAVKLASTLPTFARAAISMIRGNKDEATGAADMASASSAALAEAGAAVVPGADKKRTPWFAPRTPINVSITNQRVFSGFSLPMAEIRHIAKGQGITLNDVVLGICSGALRRYLYDLDCVPTQPLLAAVPVSLREQGNTDMNTQASIMRISLESTVDDPIERLRAIRKASAAAKAITGSLKSVLPTDFPSLGAPWLLSGVASLFGRSKIANKMPPIANVAISNVPGPKIALYLAGAKMLTYYPVSIAVHSMALNVTVQSYNGSLDFGLIACRKAMPDLVELAAYMKEAHRELLKRTPAAVVAPVVPVVAPDAADIASAQHAVVQEAVEQPSAKPRKPRASRAPRKVAVKTATAPLQLVADAQAAARRPRTKVQKAA